MSLSVPPVSHVLVDLVLLEQGLEARVVAEGVPMKAPLLPLRIQDGLELRVAPQGLQLEVGVQAVAPRIST